MWKKILKEDDKVNDMLHDFFVEMHSYVEKLQLVRLSSPELHNELKEIGELSEQVRDKLEKVLEPYFKRLLEER